MHESKTCDTCQNKFWSDGAILTCSACRAAVELEIQEFVDSLDVDLLDEGFVTRARFERFYREEWKPTG